MEFRPCIDIHNGKVKQIVGGSLADEGNSADENFVSEQGASFYAKFYKKRDIRGGHIILLNHPSSEYFQATKEQAFEALSAYPGGLQVGGGITADNAPEYLHAGASQVIVTSYVFQDGRIEESNLSRIVKAVGRERLVLDLSCRRKGDAYYIVTDRWQKETQVALDKEILDRLAVSCCEFLIHAVDVEGKAEGIEENLVRLLGDWGEMPVTYAGGVHSFEDLEKLKALGRGNVNVTIGSALDLFGGTMQLDRILEYMSKKEPV